MCQVIDYPKLRRVRRVSYEQDNFKASIRRQEILNLKRSTICCSQEYLRENALPDNKVLCIRLVLGINDEGICITNANSACESSNSFEYPCRVYQRLRILERKTTSLTLKKLHEIRHLDFPLSLVFLRRVSRSSYRN